MTVPYTGNGAYCYSNSLHMCLRVAGMADGEPPTPGFIECLTTMPFGAGYLDVDEGPVALLSPITVDPDVGVTRALDAMGWTCDDRYGDDPDEAQTRLRDALQVGPVHIGPLDMGYLSYRRACRYEPDGDHYVAALALTEDGVRVHDPDGYPYAVITMEDLLVAWRADSVPWKQGPYRMRSNLRRIRSVSCREMIDRTLELIRETVTADPGGPVVYGGPGALRKLAQHLTGQVSPQLHDTLVSFVLPLGARRSLDAALFLEEAGLHEAAAIMDHQAALCGQAQMLAMRRCYMEVAAVVDCLADGLTRLATVI